MGKGSTDGKTYSKSTWQRVIDNMGLGAHIARIFGINDEHVINPITIDTLLKCAEGYDSAKASFSHYASRSLYRAFQRYRRYEKMTIGLPDDLEGEEFCFEHDRRDMVQLAMKGLDEYDRRVLLLYYWQGLSMQDIADLLGVVKSTVWLEIQRILTLCRRTVKCEE